MQGLQVFLKHSCIYARIEHAAHEVGCMLHLSEVLFTCVIWQTHASKSKLSQYADHNCASVRLAIIGDVHGDWDSSEDGQALQALNCDAAVFVGDFNEGENDTPISTQHFADHKYAGVNVSSTCCNDVNS